MYRVEDERPHRRHKFANDEKMPEEYGLYDEREHEFENGHRHLEERHPHDLYDFDDPMSDSDYDDLDEDTGRYHDEDPVYHPSHHVKRHYTEE